MFIVNFIVFGIILFSSIEIRFGLYFVNKYGLFIILGRGYFFDKKIK